MNVDFIIDFPEEFEATTATVYFLSRRLRERQDGAISHEVRKSALPSYIANLRLEGYVESKIFTLTEVTR